MPNIGIGTGKPFNSCGKVRLCYVCSQQIMDGDYNWTFNPRASSKHNPMYRHHVCHPGKLWTSVDYVEYKQRNNPTRVNPTPPPPTPPTPPIPPTPIINVDEAPIVPTPVPIPPIQVSSPIPHMWLSLVRKARVICDEKDIPVSSSPRVSYYGIDYFRFNEKSGKSVNRDMVMEAMNRYLWEGLPNDVIGEAVQILKDSSEFRAFPIFGPTLTPQVFPAHILDPLYNPPYAQHKQAHDILNTWRMGRDGQYPLLWGNPGGGKTTLIEKFSERLTNLLPNPMPLRLITCAQDMSKTEIMGYITPQGKYVAGHFRPIWENGGFILFDECANAPASFLVTLNALLAQNRADFANGDVVKRSPYCFICFADNTNLWGDSTRHKERENAGSAFRNRLTYIDFQYDEALEEAITLERYAQ